MLEAITPTPKGSSRHVATSVGAAKQVQMEGQEALLEWAKRNRQALYWTGGILVFAAAIFGWKILSTRQSEQRASVELSAGRFALESKNYALAASEFARIGANYSGTRSADEATILLAQVRLAQGQSQQAIAGLHDLAGGAAGATTSRKATRYSARPTRTFVTPRRPRLPTKRDPGQGGCRSSGRNCCRTPAGPGWPPTIPPRRSLPTPRPLPNSTPPPRPTKRRLDWVSWGK